MTIEFGNGAGMAYENAIETEEFWGGSSRRTLTFTCAADAISMDELNGILSDEANTAALKLHGELVQPDGTAVPVTNVYEGYVLKLHVGIERRLMAQESPDAPARYEDRLVIRLGRRTYIEEQLARMGIHTV